MLVRKFFRPCMVLNNAIAMVQRVSVYHATQVQQVEDKYKPLTINNLCNQLLSDLQTSVPSKILFSLEANKKILNGSHIIVALTRFSNIYKTQKYYEKITNLSNQEFFKQLSKYIEMNMKKLKSYEILRILEILHKMNVSKDAYIVKLLAKKTKRKLNKFTFLEISRFGLVISELSMDYEILEIINVLKQNYILKMSVQFNENNINHLTYGLSFASLYLKRDKLKYNIVDQFNNFKGEISLANAIIILESLCKHIRVPHSFCNSWFDVYNKILDVIIDKYEYLDNDQLIFIINIMTQKIKADTEHISSKLYKEKFFDALIKKVVADDAGFEKALSVLKCLNYIRHESKEILNYCCASYYEKTVMSKAHVSGEAGKLLVLINGLSLARHKTIFWDEIEHFLNNNQRLLLEYDYETLTIFTLNLVILGYYPHYLLEKIFDGKFDYSKNLYTQFTFSKLYQKLKTNPNYSGPLPAESQIKSLNEYIDKVCVRDVSYQFLFKGPLLEWLGDEKYIKDTMKSKLYHVIDHVLVFDKNGEPVPINTNEDISSPEYVEDLNVPPDCNVICLIYVPHYWFWRNSDKLLGLYTVLVESLEAMNFKTVYINKADWKKVPMNERKSFLMDKIKLKLAC